MAQNPFEAFPTCCQKVLVDLEREQRRGTRNCEAGHQVSLAYAEQLKKQGKKKPVSPPAH